MNVKQNNSETFEIEKEPFRKVCVLGLGFVGSAMATVLASAKAEDGERLYDVIGIDLPNKQGKARVDALNAGIFPFDCSDQHLVLKTKNSVDDGNLAASTDERLISGADIVLVDINMNVTLSSTGAVADFESFEKAIISIGRNIQPGAIVIIETTVPPGTCEKFVTQVLQEQLVARGLSINDVYLAHSYERVMPGPQYLHSITNYWRVYSGLTDEAKSKCAEFLSSFIDVDAFPLTCLSTMTASETAKIIENTYRAVNIALMDEWGKFAEDIGVDAFEVIDAIKQRPTHRNIMRPGLGVGGYCLTKDLLFGEVSMREFFYENENSFLLSKLAHRINQNMPLRNVERLRSFLNDTLDHKRLLIMGVAYRSEVGDTRYSAVEKFFDEAVAQGAKVMLHDPFVGFWNEKQLEVPTVIPEIQDIDAVVFAVPHEIYKTMDVLDWLGAKRPLVYDCDNVLPRFEISKLRRAGVSVAATGSAGLVA